MSFKSVTLNVCCSKIPCNLLIISANGHIIQKKLINSFKSKLYFCTRDCEIKVIAKLKDKTFYKTICLNNFKHQNICVNFTFNTVLSQKILNTISLLDANYNFPISKAILNFKQKTG